jgi:hypothetical protein
LNTDKNRLIKEVIQNIVYDKQGCKITELIVDINEMIGKKLLESYIKTNELAIKLELIEIYSSPDRIDIINIISEMVEDYELVEVEYKLEKLPYRDKSFILPINSTVNIRGIQDVLA